MTAMITQVRDGIRTRLATIAGWETFARTPPAGTVPPLAVVYPVPERPVRYGTAMDGSSDDASFLIKVAVSGVESEEAESALDAYLAHSGTGSILAAIEADKRLGGLVSYARVDSVSTYGPVVIGGVPYFGAELLVLVGL